MSKSHAFALVAPPLLFVLFLLPLADGFTDDGFIHIQYARNLATYGEYSFNHGEVSFGTTSPLWVMELAAVGRFLPDKEKLIWVSRVLAWLAGLASLAAVYALALALGASRRGAWFGALVLAADVWLARWTALGMETSSAVLGVLMMSLASARAMESRRWAAMFGAFAAIASLLRPEVYLAFPVFAVASLSIHRRRALPAMATAFAVAAVLLVPWLVYAKTFVGSFLPNTAGAKSGGLVTSPITFVRKFSPVAQIVLSSQGVALVLLAASIALTRSCAVLRGSGARFAVLWVVALPVAYVTFDMQILSRYLLLVTPVLCALGWAAFEQGVRARGWSSRARRLALVVPAAVAVATSAGFYARVVVPPTRAFSHDLTHNMRGIAEYLADESSPDAVVAAADIGYLAFYSGRRVLDLGGLVEPATGALLAEHDYEEIVDRGLYFGLPGYPHVDYMIDREHEAGRFSGRTLAGHHFEEVSVTTVRNLGIRKPGPFYYTLYRVSPVAP